MLIGDNLQFLEEAVMASAWFRPVLAHRGQLVVIHCKETGETGGSYPLKGDRWQLSTAVRQVRQVAVIHCKETGETGGNYPLQ